jgi:oxaloacetate decarboxylase alpha subunit
MNVTGKERYAMFPDEVVRYALGRFGRPNVPIAEPVMDRIMASPRAKELAAEPGMADLPELRRRHGAHLSDEEFILRAVMPAEQVDAMQPPGVAPRHYDPEARQALAVLKEMLSRPGGSPISVSRPGFNLELA